MIHGAIRPHGASACTSRREDLYQRGTFELWQIGLAVLARDFRRFGETGDIIVAPE
ncbi:MAG: hypothetical protein JOZ40_21105 [Methylobacteriaceae bacterium]|nr:hypothetical protein [Methylobacteriaceae bacterium]